jgi:SAM-dependent methyltransferase
LAWRAHGAEVNAAHVEWCRRALASVDSRHNGPAAALSFDTGSMDLAFSVSVFSHLSASAAAAWLAELARVLRPGGILIATTHGENVLNTIQSSPPHQEMFRMTPEDAQRVAQRLRSEGTVYLPYDADVLDMAHAGDDYGNAFVSAEFVASAWLGTQFELCAFLPAGLRGWQDMVVLRRR